MKFTLIFFLSCLLFSVNAVPTKELFTASSKYLSETLVRDPNAHIAKEFSMRSKGGCEPVTAAPSTTVVTPTTTGPTPVTPSPSSSGGVPQTPSGPPGENEIGGCVSCAIENFNHVNDYRESSGLNRLGWSTHLSKLAEEWSKEMFDSRVFRHSDYNYWENIIWGMRLYTWDDVAQKTFENWRRSSGHDRNMRLSSHVCMGVGYYGDGISIYGTQLFSNNCP